jgi:hypothetical protein
MLTQSILSQIVKPMENKKAGKKIPGENFPPCRRISEDIDGF